MLSKAKIIRARLGYSKPQAAGIAGIGVRSLDRIERGESAIRIETLLRVALAYGCSPVDLWPPLVARPKKAKASPRRLGNQTNRQVESMFLDVIIQPGKS